MYGVIVQDISEQLYILNFMLTSGGKYSTKNVYI